MKPGRGLGWAGVGTRHRRRWPPRDIADRYAVARPPLRTGRPCRYLSHSAHRLTRRCSWKCRARAPLLANPETSGSLNSCGRDEGWVGGWAGLEVRPDGWAGPPLWAGEVRCGGWAPSPPETRPSPPEPAAACPSPSQAPLDVLNEVISIRYGTDRGRYPCETRQRLLAAAAAVFAERGYDGTRVADIASAAGVSNGALYAHFGSKAELLVAALRPTAEGYWPRCWPLIRTGR